MIKIGVTGGIGSGKSLVCRVFEILGIPVFNADAEAKKIMHSSKDVKKQIIEFFDVAEKNGDINRVKLAAIVFNDKEKLTLLNSLIHPPVFKAFENWVNKQNTKAVIIESAILFESGADKFTDIIIVVTASMELRAQRVAARDQIGFAEIELRMKNQMSDEDYRSKNALFIDNSGEKALIPQIIKIHQEILS